MRAKHPPRTRPLVVPDRHALIEAYDLASKEDSCHVIVPHLYHLTHLPKAVAVDCGSSFGHKVETAGDCDETPLRHEVLEVVRAVVFSLIGGGDVVPPEVFDMPTLAR